MVIWKRKRTTLRPRELIENEDDWEEVLRRLGEEGVDPDLPDSRRLLHVWRWLVDAETNCISLRHQLDKISRRQAHEMEEIRTCMEQMCSAWEAKVSRMEGENMQLQEEFQLRDGGGSAAIARMLEQAGLHDIAQLGVMEQVSYLLDLRQRLQAKVEQESALRRKCEQLVRLSSNLPDCLKLSSPYIQRILDRQKDEYEEEMRSQQEAMKQVKEQLKQVHEDELHRLSQENTALHTELNQLSQKIGQENTALHTELNQLSQKLQELVTHLAKQQEKDTTCLPWVQHILDGSHDKEMKNLKEELESYKNLCQDQKKQIREQCETLRILERTNKQLEIDNETLAFKLSESLSQFDELEDQLRKESTRARRESLFKQFASKESNMKNNINKMLDNRPNSQDPSLEQQLQESSLRDQLQSVQQQLELTTLKYNQHKERHREKMYKLRDLQDQEQREWHDRVEGCEKELQLLRDMLAREQEWRVQVEADCRKLKTDNQALKNGILEKGKEDNDNSSEVTAVQRDIEKIKSAASRPNSTNTSPTRRHSVWPVASYPKNW
ncbi:hypothetical protein JTE90_016135 [Oedothorax gibbosus]|uniref:Uncharacterized protein n=1 Tax=Oedothorax gibbosus TaxID=931172 RepID=A0AAV6U7B1_9ARAC|nr:hypothetical protein JTE90_016135 [Oedothorax gibbosus]